MKYKKECKEALAHVRAYCRMHAPYISSVLYGLVPHFVPDLGTLAVTKKMVLIIDPEWFVTMPIKAPKLSNKKDIKGVENYARLRMQAGCIMHECHHIIRDMNRPERMPNKELANLAFDLPINFDIAKATHQEPITKEVVRTWDLPNWAVYPKKLRLPEGLTGEQYYELLEKEQKAIPNKNKWNISGGRCGSCAGGSIDPLIEKAADEAVGRTTADRNRIRSNTIHAIRTEISANGIGTMPSSFKSLLDDEDKPDRLVPWRLTLSRVCRRVTGRMKAGRSDYSLSRPSKRSMVRNIIRPGLIDRDINILFIEDSSGSMWVDGMSPIKHVRVEVASVMQQLSIDQAWFMDADADVSAPPRQIRIKDIDRLPIFGGGGTNFGPALERARTLRPKPDIVIYLTDGAGYAPKRPPPGIEVVWCVVPTPYGTKPCNWGHLVVCSDDQELREPYGI